MVVDLWVVGGAFEASEAFEAAAWRNSVVQPQINNFTVMLVITDYKTQDPSSMTTMEAKDSTNDNTEASQELHKGRVPNLSTRASLNL